MCNLKYPQSDSHQLQISLLVLLIAIKINIRLLLHRKTICKLRVHTYNFKDRFDILHVLALNLCLKLGTEFDSFPGWTYLPKFG